MIYQNLRLPSRCCAYMLDLIVYLALLYYTPWLDSSARPDYLASDALGSSR